MIIESCAFNGLGQVLINSNQEVLLADGPHRQVIGSRERSSRPMQCTYDLALAQGRFCVGGDSAVREERAAQPVVRAATLPGGIVPGTAAGAVAPFGGGTRGIVPGSVAADGVVPGAIGTAIVPAVNGAMLPGSGAVPLPSNAGTAGGAPWLLGQCTPVLIVH